MTSPFEGRIIESYSDAAPRRIGPEVAAAPGPDGG